LKKALRVNCSLLLHRTAFAPSVYRWIFATLILPAFFAGLGVVYVNQEVQFLDARTITVLPTESENFTLLNAGAGYRLPKRRGVLSFEVNNVLDRKFRFQDYTFQITSEAENTRYIPERTFLGRLVLNF
jgi:outer membrane receptor protein involved in Fe transport